MVEPNIHYESPRVASKIVVWTGLSVLALLFFSLGLISLSFRVATGRFPIPIQPEPPAQLTATPALQIHPADDLDTLRHQEDARLGSDAALSIDKAMAAIVQRGRDAFDPLVAPRSPRPGQP